MAEERPAGGGTISLVTRQAETVRLVSAALLTVLRTVVFSLGAAVLGLFTLVPVIAVMTLACAVFAGVLLLFISRRWRTRYQSVLAAEEWLGEHTGQLVGGLRDIIACGARARATDELHGAVAAHAEAMVRLACVGAWRIGVVALGGRVPLIILLALAPWLVANGSLTVGVVLGAATYLITGLEPALRTLVESIGNLGLELSTLLRRLAVAATYQTRPNLTTGRTTSMDLALDQVTFRYGPHSDPVFEDVSLRIQAGEHLAIVGPSGAGKSTLVSVLAGIRVPERGEVMLGERPLSTLSERFMRETLVLVPQEAYLFAGTVRENLNYLAPNISDEHLARAAALLDASDLVDRLGGLDGVIELPSTLSAGERQLLVLVRAYVSPAAVIILDEATCALDFRTEAVIEDAFSARPGMLVIIAHRMSSARRADRVLVLDGSRAETGTHTELCARSGTYADLVGYWEPPGTR